MPSDGDLLKLGKYGERASAVLVAAEREAARLGHESVLPGHILLALVSEEPIAAPMRDRPLVMREGFAGQALDRLRVDVEALRESVRSRLPVAASGTPDSRQLPFTPESKSVVMEKAASAARSLGHAYVGTEHILLALYGVETAAALLVAAGAAEGAVRDEVARLMAGHAG